jgi:outer membrane protein
VLYDAGLRTQPSIKSAEYRIRSAEKSVAAGRGRMSPSLTFNANVGTGTSGLAKDVLDVKYTGDYQLIGATKGGEPVYAPLTDVVTQTTPFDVQFKSNINKSLGFSLTVPIFNGLQTRTAIKNAQINAYSAKLSLDLQKQNLYKNIVQAHANAKAALNKYRASKAGVEAAGESFRYAQQKMNAGAISAFEFNIAKNRLFSAESNLLQARYDYLFKLKVLDYYQGKPLTF